MLAAFTDTCRFKVHNLLTFPLALSGLLYHSIASGGEGFLLSAAGIGVGLLILIVPYLMGALGAGDVKFFAAISGWLGVAPMFTILVVACIATGAYSLVLLFLRGGWRSVWAQVQLTCIQMALLGRREMAPSSTPSVQEVLAKSPDYRQRLIPFSAMVGVGVLAAVVRQAIWNFA